MLDKCYKMQAVLLKQAATWDTINASVRILCPQLPNKLYFSCKLLGLHDHVMVDFGPKLFKLYYNC